MAQRTFHRHRFYFVARQHSVPEIELTHLSSIFRMKIAYEMAQRQRSVSRQSRIFEERLPRGISAYYAIDTNVHVTTGAVPRDTKLVPLVIMKRWNGEVSVLAVLNFDETILSHLTQIYGFEERHPLRECNLNYINV